MDFKTFLTSPFNKQDFLQFLSERFYGFSENIGEDAYLGSVKLDDRKELGFFIFTDVNKDIENSRAGLHKELKSLADEHSLDCAIGAFYNTHQKAWRLSFVRFNYDEKNKKESTSQKRFTFLLGNEKIKTAFEQLKNLKYPKMVDLEKAFAVEAVTKEFYKGLVKEYEKLLSDYLIYPQNDDNSKKEFAIRLIGRILFIKFLNKKSLVPDDIFEVTEGYYHDKLEQLFFEQLNTPKSERKDEFKNDSIPFLNGGLFEPLHLDYYQWSGNSSKYINMLKIDDRFFTELYDHLNQYNFTIDENSIEDSELSIDPEMLGRIFENLLAEINPETSQNARKSTGSYYTPREIVDYMVSSSLLEYLKTKTDIDEEILKTIIFQNKEPKADYDKAKILSAIFELKILDPACGSGAFLMGLLQKIVKVLNLIDEDASIWFNLQSKEFRESHKNRNKDYIRKLSIIKNTIYGIDIQPIAIEISKLRFFLSLIVDEEGEPEPLPNLEFKFVCANSLLPLPKTTVLHSDDYSKYERNLKELKSSYFEAFSKEKQGIKEEYLDTQSKLFDEIEAINLGEALSSELANYNPFDTVSIAPFFDSDFMFNIKDGFDIVIGNPPYIRQEKIKDLKPLLQKSNYASYNGTADIYIYFFELGHKVLKEKGILSFITSNKYTRAKYGKEFRKFILENSKILEYIDFNGVKVFESATVDTTILSFKKFTTKTTNNSNFIYCDIDATYQKNSELKEFITKKGFQYSQSDLSSESFTFANPKELEIKKRIEAIGTPLKKWNIKINYGVKTGFNEAFIIDTAKREELIAKDPKSGEIIKPILRGRDIKRYGYEWAGLWLINSHNNPPININEYPAIKEHLDQYYPQLEKRQDKGVTPYNLRNCAYLEEFEKDKIVYPDIGELTFTFDKNGFYFNNTVYFLNTNSKYVLSALILNPQSHHDISMCLYKKELEEAIRVVDELHRLTR